MATVAQFQTRFPEFQDVEEDRVQMFLDDTAALMGNESKWNLHYDVAHQYFAAHYLVVAQYSQMGDSGILAPVKKQEVDDVVIEHAISNVSPSFDELTSTSYGKRYWMYRSMAVPKILGV